MSSDKKFCQTNKCLMVILVALIAAIAIVCVVTFTDEDAREKANKKAALKWWQTSIVYQIYPRSFQDSDGDGTGDLRGIRSRLGYVSSLGVGAVWLSPFYKSPMRDFGYDVQNYTEVDPLFGNMTDFESLMQEAKSKKLRVILDFVPNHTSNESYWFYESERGNPKYKDYYIWSDGLTCPSGCTDTGGRQPPNNWLSVFGGSAWKWNGIRNKFYYHAFLDSQPDLNLRNENVQKELEEVLRFWLRKGVDGFRADALKFMFEAKNVSQDEVGLRDTFTWYETDNHNLTTNLPDVYDILKNWRGVLEEFANDKFLIAESYGISNEVRNQYYDHGSIPFNFALIQYLNKSCNALCVKSVIKNSLADLSPSYWPNFVIGNHDNSRVANRFGVEMIDAFNMLLLTLPGTPTSYYGEEIGMRDTFYSYKETKDPAGLNFNETLYQDHTRDPERSPMQWNDILNAGFSNGTPWLHVNKNYKLINVKTEQLAKQSHLNVYTQLAKLRQNSAFTYNDLTFVDVDGNPEQILSYIRTQGAAKYLVVLNFGHSYANDVDLSDSVGSDRGRIVVNAMSGYLPNTTISLKQITLSRGQGLVVQVL
ncbi:maltase A3-like [Ostrea edulis]|uniref:maltase A3-like n=1 Tax=Ostrea edulis TaxID=37623 RepID=UPI0020958B31|nr:maltase A3-like [Ostrea edulis]